MRYASFLAEVQDVIQAIRDLSKSREVSGDPKARAAAGELAAAVGQKNPKIVAKARQLTGLTPDEAIKKVVSGMAEGQ